MVQLLETKEQFDKVMADAGDKIVFVDFTATWCGPCKIIGPVFEKMAEKYPNMVFVKVDVDENEEVSGEAGISAMPTFQVYKNGKKIDEMVGANDKKLEDLCLKHCQ